MMGTKMLVLIGATTLIMMACAQQESEGLSNVKPTPSPLASLNQTGETPVPAETITPSTDSATSTPTQLPTQAPSVAPTLEPTVALQIPVELSIPAIEVPAGGNRSLVANFLNQQGQIIESARVSWAVLDPEAGSLGPDGTFEASEIAGSFDAAVEATSLDPVFKVTAKVSVVPGQLEQIGIAPESIDLGMGMDQQFVAAGADRFGNRISGLDFNWSVEAGGGSIDQNGLFTAGSRPGKYNQTVKVEAGQGAVNRSVATRVTVDPDRIAFISRREAGRGRCRTPNTRQTNHILFLYSNGCVGCGLCLLHVM